MEHFDVVIIGGGLSGVGAGYHLQTNCPSRTYVILEGRERIGRGGLARRSGRSSFLRGNTRESRVDTEPTARNRAIA